MPNEARVREGADQEEMKSIDDICRDIVRKRDGRDYRCPYGRRLSFDDLWEADKNHLRETVKIALESAQEQP